MASLMLSPSWLVVVVALVVVVVVLVGKLVDSAEIVGGEMTVAKAVTVERDEMVDCWSSQTGTFLKHRVLRYFRTLQQAEAHTSFLSTWRLKCFFKGINSLHAEHSPPFFGSPTNHSSTLNVFPFSCSSLKKLWTAAQFVDLIASRWFNLRWFWADLLQLNATLQSRQKRPKGEQSISAVIGEGSMVASIVVAKMRDVASEDSGKRLKG